jgi:uncharacterized phage infection (PIP) family protein YhgE
MTEYTNPIKATFELQRKTLEQGQQTIAQGIDFQRQVSDSVVAGVESQEELQRRVVELNRDTLHTALDAIEGIPNADVVVEDLRETVDSGYDEALASHEEVFDALAEELEGGIEDYDSLVDELVETLDEQFDVVVDAHEELEAQSVEATEELAGQVEDLQEQADDVQAQIRKVSEEAADAVEA